MWQQIISSILKKYGPQLVEWAVEYFKTHGEYPDGEAIEKKVQTIVSNVEPKSL